MRPFGKTLVGALLAASTLGAAGIAQAEVKLDGDGFNASSDDGRYTFGVHGRVQFDGGWFDNDDRGADNANGTELRRVRLAISGKLDDWSYLADFDFAGGEITGQTVAISRALGPGTWSIGQIKPFFSLEYTTDDLWVSMQERSWISDVMAPGYRYGTQWVGNNEHWVYGVNLYNQANMDSDRNSGVGGSGRVVWLPLDRDAGVLHLGADVGRDQIGRGPDDAYTGTSASVRAAGHLSDQSRFTLVKLNDGREVDIDKYVGEFAYSRGPFYVQSEYGKSHYDDGAQDADLTTGYAIVGWFITGQTRGYDRKRARFTRPDGIGPGGAWELALRYDMAQGEQTGRDIKVQATALGVNWYASRNVLFRLDYIHSEAKDQLANAILDKTNAVTGRVQIAF
ncbi:MULTISPECIES: OprO/OprP family phosphate-selective porin [Gammaproteobacteria]|uniref:OprO/OprP family phosphate-selective porin n=1 Tax=Gammaproteobacteria TaxID=1236 RepID=UPI0015ABF8BC|nr:porin [Pseudomonas sp. Hp2]